jgi:hypothetical protein
MPEQRQLDLKLGSRRRVIQSMVRLLHERTGVEGHRDWKSSRGVAEHVWHWEAALGESMNWAQKLGVKWPPKDSSIEIGFWSFWEDTGALLELDGGMFAIHNFHEEYDECGRLVQSESMMLEDTPS